MVNKCIVPYCNGNYKNGPRVTVFSFPKESSLRNAWLRSIQREENYEVNIHSRVCENHFTEDNMVKEVQAFDEKNCRMITAKLNRQRLKDGAIPTVFPMRPSPARTSRKCALEERRKGNPPFSSEEVHALVDLLDQHRTIIFDKSCSSAAKCAKDTVWTKITEAFNMKGFPHNRDANGLRQKWDNMKRKARKRTRNFTEMNDNEYAVTSDLTARVATLITEFETPTEKENGNTVTEYKHIRTISIDGEQWDVVMVGAADANDAPKQNSDKKRIPKLRWDVNSVLNFTPEECRRLMQCVNAEKKIILCKGTSVETTRIKNNAWTRVSREFNKGNVCKRSIKALKEKFENMRTQAPRGRVDNEAEACEDITRTNSAAEQDNVKGDCDVEVQDCSLDWEPDNILFELPQQMDAVNSDSDSSVTATDPLASVTSIYSDAGAKPVNTNVLLPVTDSDILRLKAEILQCKLETAKQKQSHEKEASVSVQTDRRLRVRLLALQLHEARLNTWIAERRAMQAGATRDVLQYRQDERAAQDMGDRLHS